MANFNDFDEVRVWLSQHDLTSLRTALTDGSLRGKTLEVACAYVEHVNEHGYDAIFEQDEDEQDLKWEWRPWRIALVTSFLVGPPLLVWGIRVWGG